MPTPFDRQDWCNCWRADFQIRRLTAVVIFAAAPAAPRALVWGVRCVRIQPDKWISRDGFAMLRDLYVAVRPLRPPCRSCALCRSSRKWITCRWNRSARCQLSPSALELGCPVRTKGRSLELRMGIERTKTGQRRGFPHEREHHLLPRCAVKFLFYRRCQTFPLAAKYRKFVVSRDSR